MNWDIFLPAGFSILNASIVLRDFEVGDRDQGSFERGTFKIVYTGAVFRSEVRLASWNSDGVMMTIGESHTEETAIRACEEWEAVENGKRILMPEQYRKKDIGVDWINGPCLAVPYSLHQISAAARQSGKTFAAVGEALQKGLSLEMLNIISDLKLKPNHDEEKP